MSWLADNSWVAWLGLALALVAIEAASVDFVFLMLAGGALAGCLAAALGLPLLGQVIIAVVVASLLVVLLRPWLKRHFMASIKDSHIGSAGQIGRTASVIKTVTEHDGRVQLRGETWSARLAPGAAECLPGQEVRVVSIEGATAIVTPVAAGQKSEQNNG